VGFYSWGVPFFDPLIYVHSASDVRFVPKKFKELNLTK
jgi:hypothetical protein